MISQSPIFVLFGANLAHYEAESDNHVSASEVVVNDVTTTFNQLETQNLKANCSQGRQYLSDTCFISFISKEISWIIQRIYDFSNSSSYQSVDSK